MKTTVKILLLSMVLTSCGSVQTINGVRIKDKENRPNVKNYVLVTAVSFGFGYYLGSEVLPQKKKQ